jgi:hypothetical protein
MRYYHVCKSVLKLAGALDSSVLPEAQVVLGVKQKPEVSFGPAANTRTPERSESPRHGLERSTQLLRVDCANKRDKTARREGSVGEGERRGAIKGAVQEQCALNRNASENPYISKAACRSNCPLAVAVGVPKAKMAASSGVRRGGGTDGSTSRKGKIRCAPMERGGKRKKGNAAEETVIIPAAFANRWTQPRGMAAQVRFL